MLKCRCKYKGSLRYSYAHKILYQAITNQWTGDAAVPHIIKITLT